MHSKGVKALGRNWISKLIRKLWDLQFSMWQHRYEYLHQSNKGLHEHEQNAIDSSIRQEHLIGRHGLSMEYQQLFHGDVNLLLKANWRTKLQWLDKVWAGRDRLRLQNGQTEWHKDPIAKGILLKEDKLRKRAHNLGETNRRMRRRLSSRVGN